MLHARVIVAATLLHLLTAFLLPCVAQPVHWSSIELPHPEVIAIEHTGSTLVLLTVISLDFTEDSVLHWYGGQPTPAGIEGGYDILLLRPHFLVLSQLSLMWCSTDMGSTWNQVSSVANYAARRFWRGNSGGFFAYAEIFGGTGSERKEIHRYSADGVLLGEVYSDLADVHDFCVSPSGEYLVAINGYNNALYPWLSHPPKVMHRFPSDLTWVDYQLTRTGYAIAALSDSAGSTLLFAGHDSSGVWRSSDAGVHWDLTNNGLTNSAIRRLVAAPDGTLLAVANGGELFYTKDQGDHWIDMSAGLPVGETLRDIAFDSAGRIYAADAEGVYRSSETLEDLPATGGTPHPPTVPSSLILHQNYPNPFNAVTTIEFTQPRDGYTTLSVFNVLGRVMATLIQGAVSAGPQTARWDATGSPSGVYFIRLTTGGEMISRKALLTR